MLAEGAWKIASEAGTKAWVDLSNAWNSWVNFYNWLMDSINNFLFGGGGGSTTTTTTTTTGNTTAGK